MKSFHLILLLLLASQFSMASDQETQTVPRPFSVHDMNRDGFLDAGEYRELQNRRQLRLEQGRARGWRRHQRLLDFESIDSNGDSLISVDELGEAVGNHQRHRGRFRQGLDCRRE